MSRRLRSHGPLRRASLSAPSHFLTCVAAQTHKLVVLHYVLEINQTISGDDVERVIIVKDALLAEINQEMASLHACRNLRVMDIVVDPARALGANWMTAGFLRSGYDHTEFECHRAMVDFMADLQEYFDI